MAAVANWYKSSLPLLISDELWARYLTISKCSRSSSVTNSQSLCWTACPLILRHASSIDNYCFETSYCSSVCYKTALLCLASNSCANVFDDPASWFSRFFIGWSYDCPIVPCAALSNTSIFLLMSTDAACVYVISLVCCASKNALPITFLLPKCLACYTIWFCASFIIDPLSSA
jgi:hypothetical protein